jgi:hypothetical protein
MPQRNRHIPEVEQVTLAEGNALLAIAYHWEEFRNRLFRKGITGPISLETANIDTLG